MAHWPGLRPSSPSFFPQCSTQHRARARLWNFPGGNSSQRPSLASHVQYILSHSTTPDPQQSWVPGPSPLECWALLSGGSAEQPRKETGPLVTPAYLSQLLTSSRHICDLSFSVVYCVEARPSSQLRAGLASRGPRRPSQPSPEQPPPAVPSAALSQVGPKLWPSRALVMEPQGLSPLLSAYVYSLTHVCLMILFRVTPQSG